MFIMDSTKTYMIVLLILSLLVNMSHGSADSEDNNNIVGKCCEKCHCSGTTNRPNDKVDCTNRNLNGLPTCKWPNVRTLYLGGNNITNLTSAMMLAWRNLRELDLRNNSLSSLPAPVNITMNLRELYLDNNSFTSVPTNALLKMPKLRILYFSANAIKSIPMNAFKKQRKLEVLILSYNDHLMYLHPRFLGPSGKNLKYLDLSFTKIKNISFQGPKKMKKFETLDVNYARLTQFPNLTLMPNMRIIGLEDNNIEEVPEDLCKTNKGIDYLDFNSNRLKKMPNVSSCSKLQILKLDHNDIDIIGDNLHGATNLLDITLVGNRIEHINKDDFKGLEKLESLNLKDNKIVSIHENAFSTFKMLGFLKLENNQFPSLPTKGLQTIQSLSIKGNTRLLDFPAPSYFPKLDKLAVHYPYHCCMYPTRKHNESSYTDHPDITFEIRWLTTENITNASHADIDLGYSGDVPNGTVDYFFKPHPVDCTPQPDPFSPCEDLMGDWMLRCGVWLVFLLALAGNATVIIVILASHTKMDVSRFLISNLAFADLFMGIYLGFLAIVDVTTFGNFNQYALDWQTSAGCQTAGFLAVMSSELSVFTLTVITLERYVAIKNAIRVNRKLELKTAMVVMAIGWVFAIVTACLPLLQISNYGKFSVCLPFETGNTKSKIFLAVILCLNASAFVVILSCYILMYCSIRGSNAWNASDFRVAKRMALLVITDFLCWAPIVFLSLTAAFGSTLVSLHQAKVITVFIFPLNSCANPFLYAIFTSHFKKDLVAICRRVEDKYPFFKITRNKISFSRRSSYSGAASENANLYLRMRKYSLPIIGRVNNSVTSNDGKGMSSASTNSNNKTAETNVLINYNGNIERETTV